MTPEGIIIHCAATRVTSNVDVKTIDKWHKDRGFKRAVSRVKNGGLAHIGYQYYVTKDGEIAHGRDEDEVGAHTLGFNDKTISICYEGGLDANGKAADTRTPEQKEAILHKIKDIQSRWKIKYIKGHRDTSPDKNGNGIIEKHEWLKECPCFESIPEYKHLIN